eukprot:4363241-Amphidinium_carterae.1
MFCVRGRDSGRDTIADLRARARRGVLAAAQELASHEPAVAKGVNVFSLSLRWTDCVLPGIAGLLAELLG